MTNQTGYSVVPNAVSNSSTSVLQGINVTTQANAVTTVAGEGSSHVLAYILVPLGSLAVVGILAFVVVMIFRKNKLDKLRHHLMPLYNFDPTEEEDWESELLEGDRNRRINFRDETPSPNSPKLKFSA